ncbi:MAG: phosphotransferase [Alphaproteobacteria bacterium]|nr:phosphotransferase [Alphaproteobacteria bacterium]
MTDRDAQCRAFLDGTHWQSWSGAPLAGDASARRYVRLTGPAGARAILMDADPALGEQVAPFVRIAEWLVSQGLSAPRILHHAMADGFLLLDDLGPDTIAVAAASGSEDDLYDAAVDVLIALDAAPPPDGLTRMVPQVGADMVAIVAETYHPGDPGPLVAATHDALLRLAPQADRIALRDYHAENLIWRPERAGLDRVGLLDFQDAFIAPRGYDLASLLRDIRRPVSEAQVTRQTARFAAATQTDPVALSAQLAALGAQRNLRILGVFARLVQRGKSRYAAYLPVVWDTLLRDLAYPDLRDLREVVMTTLPPPQDRR